MSATVIALAVTLVLVLVLASVLVALLYVRLRQKRSYNGAVEASPLTPGFGIFNFIPPWHPAAQITPFGSSPRAPVFSELSSRVHKCGAFKCLHNSFTDFEPGTNMRIAHRNSRGGWEFFDSGLPENDKLPRPQSVRSSIFTRSAPSLQNLSSPASISSSHWTAGPSSASSREPLTAAIPSTAPPPPAYCKDEKR